MTELCIELRRLRDFALAGRQQGVLSVFFISEVIEYNVRHDRGDNLDFPAPDAGFYRPKKQVISHDRQENGGKDLGEGQVRGLIERRKIRGGSPSWVSDSLHLRHPWTEECDWRTR